MNAPLPWPTPEGGRVDARAGLRDDFAEISVVDTGVGTAQDARVNEFRKGVVRWQRHRLLDIRRGTRPGHPRPRFRLHGLGAVRLWRCR
jgi:hypothetical protein